MATSRFCATSSGAETFLHSSSFSRLIDCGYRSSKSRLLFVRTARLPPLRRTFLVKCVSSEPKQKLKDSVTEQGGTVFCVLSFSSYFSYCSSVVLNINVMLAGV